MMCKNMCIYKRESLLRCHAVSVCLTTIIFLAKVPGRLGPNCVRISDWAQFERTSCRSYSMQTIKYKTNIHVHYDCFRTLVVIVYFNHSEFVYFRGAFVIFWRDGSGCIDLYYVSMSGCLLTLGWSVGGSIVDILYNYPLKHRLIR